MLANAIEQITEIADGIASKLGLAVVDVRINQQGPRQSLEVTIYKPAGQLSLSDCETMSKQLGLTLDEITPPLVSGNYLLEVQSPGIDRLLKTDRELRIFTNSQINVKTKIRLDGFGHELTGILSTFNDHTIDLWQAQPLVHTPPSSKSAKQQKPVAPAKLQSVTIERNNIVSIRLAAQDKTILKEVVLESS